MSTAQEQLDLAAATTELTPLPVEQRVAWAVERFGEDAVLLSSMQKTSTVLMHVFSRLGLDNEILFGDTGFHFLETLRYRDLFLRRFGVNIVTLYPEQTPEQQEVHFGRKLYLFVDGQKECCRLRKEEPFLSHMKQHGRRLVMSGLRKEEGSRRGGVKVIGRDPRFDGFELHPLFDWTEKQVEGYIAEHDLPVHPLHAQSYPSIGCQVCTTPVAPGEDPRAGRWRHLRTEEDEGPKFCGINFSDGGGI